MSSLRVYVAGSLNFILLFETVRISRIGSTQRETHILQRRRCSHLFLGALPRGLAHFVRCCHNGVEAEVLRATNHSKHLALEVLNFFPQPAGPPARCPFSPFFFGWEGSPTKIDYRKKRGGLILTSLLEDLVKVSLSLRVPFLLWVFKGDQKEHHAHALVRKQTWF